MSTFPYVTVGKSAASTIEAVDAHVSRHHAVLFETEEGWLIYDLDSTNGTFVNGKKIKAALVSTEDVVTLGHAYRLDIDRVAGAFVQGVHSGGDAFLRIGKSADNDVVATDPRVSRFHALLRRSGQAVDIFDAGSTNGLFIDGQRVLSGTVQPETTIGLGPTFTLSGRELIERAVPEPSVVPASEQAKRTGKTTWVRRQLDLMRNEQVRELRELERKHVAETSRTRSALAWVGVAAVIAVVALTTTMYHTSGGDASLNRILESRRDAVVMIRCLSEPREELYVAEGEQSQGRGGEIELFSSRYGSELQGSGFVFHYNGRPVVITNRHVVEPWLRARQAGRSTRLLVMTQGAARTYEAEVLKAHPAKDVAILGFLGEQPSFSELELQPDWSTVQPGDRVGFMSFPLGFSGQRSSSLSADIGKGSISNKFDEEVKHDIVTAPGSSGGPIFNSSGQVIAINTAQSRDKEGTLFQGLNWGVPVRYALELLRE